MKDKDNANIFFETLHFLNTKYFAKDIVKMISLNNDKGIVQEMLEKCSSKIKTKIISSINLYYSDDASISSKSSNSNSENSLHLNFLWVYDVIINEYTVDNYSQTVLASIKASIVEKLISDSAQVNYLLSNDKHRHSILGEYSRKIRRFFISFRKRCNHYATDWNCMSQCRKLISYLNEEKNRDGYFINKIEALLDKIKLFVQLKYHLNGMGHDVFDFNPKEQIEIMSFIDENKETIQEVFNTHLQFTYNLDTIQNVKTPQQIMELPLLENNERGIGNNVSFSRMSSSGPSVRLEIVFRAYNLFHYLEINNNDVLSALNIVKNAVKEVLKCNKNYKCDDVFIYVEDLNKHFDVMNELSDEMTQQFRY